jgi:arylsulfatase
MDLRAALLAIVLAGCATAAEDTPPNFIIVSLDTLRADRLGTYGGQPNRTPNLDRFAAESVVFEHAYAQAPETLFSHASLFTSRYASELGPVDYTFTFPDDVPTLAEVLSIYGYATGAAVGGGHMSPLFGLHRGFARYTSPREWGSLWHTIAPALDWVDTAARPFFLFLHGYDAHSRYLKPTPVGYLYADPLVRRPAQRIVRDKHGTDQVADHIWYRRQRFPDIFDLSATRPWGPEARAALAKTDGPKRVPLDTADNIHIQRIYDGAATYADLQFGLFMAELADRKLLANTWIIVLSDHGEELGEDGLFNHRLTLSEAVLRVPLMIRPPGGLGTGKRVAGLTALIDVMPTLIELAGAQVPAATRGRSLVPAIHGESLPARASLFAEGVFREIATLTPTGGFVLTGMSAHSPHLVTALAATSATSPAYRSWGAVDRSQAKTQLEEWRTSLPPSPGSTAPADPARTEALRKKGYWGPE